MYCLSGLGVICLVCLVWGLYVLFVWSGGYMYCLSGLGVICLVCLVWGLYVLFAWSGDYIILFVWSGGYMSCLSGLPFFTSYFLQSSCAICTCISMYTCMCVFVPSTLPALLPQYLLEVDSVVIVVFWNNLNSLCEIVHDFHQRKLFTCIFMAWWVLCCVYIFWTP